MPFFGHSSPLLAYLGSFQNVSDQDRRKLLEKFHYANASDTTDFVYKAATFCDTGRLATGGKSAANAPGKARPTTATATADTCKIKENYQHGGSSWTYINNPCESDVRKASAHGRTIFPKVLPTYSACCLTSSISKEKLDVYKRENWDRLRDFIERSTAKRRI
ncbi:uncharacterized protein LOC116174696 [Photinus pyralis]|uniref:uncharacterized protein LOC116174696 n=1 Tax=Photinus pyralis TaxID=7054 RepID=UPI0012677802|nr:uncharacterized protein LOC116174696 [Photinus pyralis]